jgi:hypothetical protein
MREKESRKVCGIDELDGLSAITMAWKTSGNAGDHAQATSTALEGRWRTSYAASSCHCNALSKTRERKTLEAWHIVSSEAAVQAYRSLAHSTARRSHQTRAKIRWRRAGSRLNLRHPHELRLSCHQKEGRESIYRRVVLGLASVATMKNTAGQEKEY